MSDLADNVQEYHSLAGPDTLPDHVLVSQLLSISHDDAQALLQVSGGLENLRRMCVSDLRTIKGIGPAKVGKLCAALELGIRVAQAGPAKRLRLMASSDDVASYFKPRLAGLSHEELHVVLVDCRNRAFRVELVARGGLVGLSVHPREVFVSAVREGAAGIILVHNHPSGDPTPSMADRELTHRVRQAGEILGVPLLDHVVVASGGALSV